MTLRGRPAPAWLRPGVFCLAGVLCAVCAVVVRSHAQTPRRVVTVNIVTAPAAAVVAADDCPVDETCALGGVRQAVVSTVLAAFPGTLADVTHGALTGTQLGETIHGETVYRETVDMRTPAGVLVRMVSRCVEHGSAVRASQSATVPAAGPATVFAVVPGRAGCSVGVILRVPAGVIVPWQAAMTLAHRPALQLPG